MTFDPAKLYADRLGGERFGTDTAIYKFEKIKRARKAFQAAHPEIPVINVGVGEHDGLEPEVVSNIIAEEVRKKCNKGYPDNGIKEFQEAAVRYVNRSLGLSIPEADAEKWAIHGIGSKNILALLPLSFVNPPRFKETALGSYIRTSPADVVLMTTPGYPVLGTHTGFLQGQVVKMPLKEENGFLPDLKSLEADIDRIESKVGKIKVFCLNYPNNPTGADAPLEFWNEVSRLAHKHNFVVVQDAAYAGWSYGGRKPSGILQAEGGLECGIGIYSMSKAFNMIGRRIAFAVGNPKLMAAHANIKDNSDSGQDSAIQRAAAYALDHPEFTEQIGGKYERRLERLVHLLGIHGFSTKMPDGSFYLYTRAPTGTKNGERFENAEQATKYMLEQHGVSTVPWDEVGAYLRFSATFDSGLGENILSGSPIADEPIFLELDKRLRAMKLTFD